LLEVFMETVAERVPALEVGVEYYWKRSGSWRWFDGLEHWWEVFVEVSGFNGSGGYWLYERWRWNGSSENIRNEIKTLSYHDSAVLSKEVHEAARWRADEARLEVQLETSMGSDAG
jgi:hypothetical protein